MRNRTQPTAALLATLALLTGGAGFTTRSSAAAPPLEASVDAYLRPYLDLNVFQGVVLVARGDRILLEKGYGYANVELAVRNTPDRVFRIASLTKPFTQVALGRLVEEKRLALSAPLARYLPDFPNGDRITLEMLRTHKAGIPNLNSIPFDEEARGSNTLDSLVRLLARQPLTFEPGSRTRYSNGGYALLGAVIEKVTGMSYGDYLARAVLGPLALTHTRHEATGTLVPNRAYGYTVSGGDRRVLVTPPFQEMNTKTGGGSLVSTAGDLHRFLRAMNRDNVVRAATWKLLFGDDSTFSYQGRCPGFNVVMARDFMHDVDVVVLCNNYAAGMVGTIAQDLLPLARGLEVEKPRWRGDLRADSAMVASFTGTWRASTGALPYGDGPFDLRWHRGELVLFLDGTAIDVLIPQGGDAFLLRNLWSEARLARGPEGPGATLRPLWYERDPVPLERLR